MELKNKKDDKNMDEPIKIKRLMSHLKTKSSSHL